MKLLSKVRKMDDARWRVEKKSRMKEKRLMEIISLRDQGLTYQEIADKLGLDRTWISKLIRMQQLPLPFPEQQKEKL